MWHLADITLRIRSTLSYVLRCEALQAGKDSQTFRQNLLPTVPCVQSKHSPSSTRLLNATSSSHIFTNNNEHDTWGGWVGGGGENCSHVYLFIYLFTATGLLTGGSGYFTWKQNMKLVTTRFKSGGLHEKHVVATWNLGNHLSICL